MTAGRARRHPCSAAQGSIHRNYDLLLSHRLHIVGEVYLRVNHCLLALPGTAKADVKRVMSHPQALSQCEGTLARMRVVKEAVDDTAGAAKMVAEGQMRRARAAAAAGAYASRAVPCRQALRRANRAAGRQGMRGDRQRARRGAVRAGDPCERHPGRPEQLHVRRSRAAPAAATGISRRARPARPVSPS